MTIMLEKTDAKFWEKNVTVGKTITLTDYQSLSDSVDEGLGTLGMDYKIESLRVVACKEIAAQWRFFELNRRGETLWLLAKIVGREMDLRVYFEPPEFQNGDRQNILDAGQYWLFQEPSDPENFRLDELEYTKTIGEPLVANHYVIKPFGSIFGRATHKPIRAGLEDVLAQIVEYQSDDEGCENPEILIVELGGEENETGGYISFLLGAPITPAEVDVL